MPSGLTHGPSEIEQFRREVQEFLSSSIDADMRAASARQLGLYSEPSIGRKWHRILYERGWITPMWPLEFGGAGWSSGHRYVFEQEAARHEAPTLPAAGLLMCGPILIAFGTPEQQQRFLPRLRSGDDYWCQGYSEPDAGSDLASLKCRAIRDGDDYVVTGTKIWTTHAQHANWIFMLVRTDNTDRPQRGISFLLADLASPGITIRPIMSMSGEHEVNQVFFDNVRVPVRNRVGAENEGWSIAKRLLEFERSGIYGPRIRRILARAERVARETGEAWASLDYRRRFAEACIAADVLEAGELRLLSQPDAAGAKKTTSILKLAGTEAMQRATELALYASGTDAAYLAGSQGLNSAALEGSISMARYLNSRAATIYGGSSEVQRNILAKTALDL
jgi:alkylation response protein AidB-like acyl-CoA dehydrogenase